MRPAALVVAAGLVFAALAAGQGSLSLGVDPVLALGEPAGAPRAGEALERATEDLAARMRCPVCQGLSIADSPTESALAMKSEVRELLAAGYSEEQILDYFERSYGEFIRLVPKTRGFNWLVWLAPVAALLAGVALVVARLRRARPRAAVAVAGDAGEADADLEAYLEQVRREVGP